MFIDQVEIFVKSGKGGDGVDAGEQPRAEGGDFLIPGAPLHEDRRDADLLKAGPQDDHRTHEADGRRRPLEILGVHCFGSQASEIIHIGQAILAQKGKANSLMFFINTTFNYPTMAEAYRVAALNGLNRVRALRSGD